MLHIAHQRIDHQSSSYTNFAKQWGMNIFVDLMFSLMFSYKATFHCCNIPLFFLKLFLSLQLN